MVDDANVQTIQPAMPTPSAPLILAISELIDFRDTQPTCPCPTIQFTCAVTAALAWLGPGWFAIPSPV